MTGVALYELSGQYRELMHKLDGLDLDAQTIADTIEASGLTDALAVKAQGVELVARAATQYVPAIEAEIARLQALKSARERVAQGLRDYLLRNMKAAEIDKIECPFFNIRIQKNPPAVDVFEPGLVPSEFMRQPAPPPPAVDKSAIKEALKAGRDVPGARLTQGERLAIK